LAIYFIYEGYYANHFLKLFTTIISVGIGLVGLYGIIYAAKAERAYGANNFPKEVSLGPLAVMAVGWVFLLSLSALYVILIFLPFP
jgi:hypothetical protein